MSEDIRKMINKVKNFKQFVNENKSFENEVVSFINKKMLEDKKEIMGFLTETTNNKEIIKTKLFEILKGSEYVERHNYLYSINLTLGAPMIFVDLDENDFFDETKSVFDIISGLWPYEDYEKWKNLYYTLVLGYVIKDKIGDSSMTLEIYRREKSVIHESGEPEFDVFLIPSYGGETKKSNKTSGEKMFINGEILNVFGFDDNPVYKPSNDFIKMGVELSKVATTVEDYKFIFKYLDAII